MARKINNNKKEVEVELTEVQENIDNQEDVKEDVQEIPEINVEVPQPKVEVNTEVVKEKPVIEKDVRIRVAKSHRCFIGGELYDLKEGVCYNVPEFVKSVLNKAGILAPL